MEFTHKKWKEIRTFYNLSQPDFAKKLDTTQAAISMIESGKTKNPSVDLTSRLFKAFPDINTNWFFNKDEVMLKSVAHKRNISLVQDEFSLPESYHNDLVLIEYEKRIRSHIESLKREIKSLEKDKSFLQNLVQGLK